MKETIDDIHAFWFGALDENGMCAADHNPLWFTSSAQTDATCRTRFGHLVEQAIAGKFNRWVDSDNGLIALVVLLDQFTRNIYRGTAQAFTGDTQALAIARHSIDRGRHQRLPAIHQVFLYLPLEHSENMDAQEECVTLFEELAEVTGSEQITSFTRYAVAHRDVIAQFGRFAHRNAVLGRESSPAELAYLEKHGGF
ncbi:MAG: DUF924 domain-containing protein [Gammaproteobacteria bacterium]|nr:MAG: DUF924 domain-containing protein [Gammaproteobacteria bacterium]RLA52363.1 MAG: DUF924 domain-containing protein [Gammaproteobacteria bacterium]HDY83961.1 DUF924 domain-containing protein [Halieaceae bacterium]